MDSPCNLYGEVNPELEFPKAAVDERREGVEGLNRSRGRGSFGRATVL